MGRNIHLWVWGRSWTTRGGDSKATDLLNIMILPSLRSSRDRIWGWDTLRGSRRHSIYRRYRARHWLGWCRNSHVWFVSNRRPSYRRSSPLHWRRSSHWWVVWLEWLLVCCCWLRRGARVSIMPANIRKGSRTAKKETKKSNILQNIVIGSINKDISKPKSIQTSPLEEQDSSQPFFAWIT